MSDSASEEEKTVPDVLKEAASAVFNEIGAGHSERVYHNSMETELSHRGLPFSSEGSLPVYYRGKSVGFRKPDMFVGEEDDKDVIVELKAGESRSGEEQLLSYVGLGKNDENIELEAAVLIEFTEGGPSVTTVSIPDGDEDE